MPKQPITRLATRLGRPRRFRLPQRFLRDLETWTELDQPLENVNHAQRLVRYFIDCIEYRLQPDRRVMCYIQGALERAAKSGKLRAELGLDRARRGNPGIRSAKRAKRRLSADDRIEIALRLAAVQEQRGALSRELDAIADDYGVSRRHLERIRRG